jgi:5-oxoprolinase (ATP-hydrolysing)
MPWHFWIDRGGTFTDIVARAPTGGLITRKLLSENPHSYDDAAVAGMRAILAEHAGLSESDPFPAEDIAAIKMGTTVATNALLERNGARTVFAVTQGFADVLRIGTQNRPRLFDLHIKLPEMLYEQAIEIPERVSAIGEVLRPLDEDTTRARLQTAFKSGARSLAVALMHGYRFTAHEKRVAEIARDIGFTHISASYSTSPLMKLVGRGDTTVANAYLSPLLRRYVDHVSACTNHARLLFMQSNGGLADAHHFQGKDAVLSGPAGGVIGAAETARAAGFVRIIGFDMGGTSTDVCHVNAGPGGEDYERGFDNVIAGIRIRAPMMQIHTVAAGGGSILTFDGLRFKVGPESAGADPGPACYGRGGPLTVTDANVLLGKIQPDYFPAVFGANGNAKLNAAIVREKFAALAAKVTEATGQTRTPEDLAKGFLALAVDNMARAIRTISVQRGHDVTKYTLACFGGAGGQHACLVADALGMTTVFIHPLAGVLSAYGIGLAKMRVIKDRTVEAALTNEGMSEIEQVLGELEAAARYALADQGVEMGAIAVRRSVHVRYAGTDTALEVAYSTAGEISEAFARTHKAHFGFVMEGRALICQTAVAEAVANSEPISANVASKSAAPKATADISPEAVTTISGGAARSVPLHHRAALRPSAFVDGLAVIAEDLATTVVERGWRAVVNETGGLVLTRTTPNTRRQKVGHDADPLLIEIFNNLFMSIAEQMGAVLQNTSQSVNIKERLDFSCAVFDAHGNLVANAPHMPVHLGSMGESVRAVLVKHAHMEPDDVYVLNNPYNGGTHLPDITVVTPVFLGGEQTPLFFTASRGHHADVGGRTPGSMPPTSTTVEEEGALLDSLVMVRGGVFQEDAIRAALTAGPFPARNPDMNLADLRAQSAANMKGAAELHCMAGEFGRDVVEAYMSHVQDHAEEAVRRVIGKLKSGSFTCPMDDGGEVRVAVTVDTNARSAVVDFTGTSGQRPTNFNAPSAVCRAAVLYVFRTLVADDIPMNEGVLRPLTLKIPAGSMLSPKFPGAVVAGNVETSQIICDCLYGALGVIAASQGTMSNFTFGNARYQYYETICGGAGAGADFDGASAVHTHMTNSRLTDPEVLEWRYPVTVEHFSIRKNSGGHGKHKGGDGVVRTIRFHESMTAAILSGRRTTKPFGLNGGEDGSPGKTVLTGADGSTRTLAATEEITAQPGDSLTITTPGGGGFGTRQIKGTRYN